METLLTVISGLLGAAVGSFLNVCIDRLPAGKSLAYPPSHCDACQRRLTPLDLIPVVSYLWLRRRCRYCRAPIPRRVLWVELGTGLLFAFIYRQLGLSTQLAVTMFYSALFIVLGVIDLEQKLLLNKIIYPAAGIALIIDGFLPHSPGIVSGLIGGGIGFTLLLIPALI
ncbi:MAG: prepilin peptidase, partial [Chloroflexota bacterium]